MIGGMSQQHSTESAFFSRTLILGEASTKINTLQMYCLQWETLQSFSDKVHALFEGLPCASIFPRTECGGVVNNNDQPEILNR